MWWQLFKEMSQLVMYQEEFLLFAHSLGGTICCLVTGRRRFSSDLPQGGLEIPCKLKFQGESREIAKLKKLIASPCVAMMQNRIEKEN